MKSKEATPYLCDQCGEPCGNFRLHGHGYTVCSVACEDKLTDYANKKRRSIQDLEPL